MTPWKTRAGPRRAREIRRRFGENVAAIVDGCTDTDVVPKPPWRARKEAYIAHVRKASPSVRLVSAADKLDNARAVLGDYRIIGEGLWERFKGGKDGSLWYYSQLVKEFREAGGGSLVDELDLVVKKIHRLAAN